MDRTPAHGERLPANARDAPKNNQPKQGWERSVGV